MLSKVHWSSQAVVFFLVLTLNKLEPEVYWSVYVRTCKVNGDTGREEHLRPLNLIGSDRIGCVLQAVLDDWSGGTRRSICWTRAVTGRVRRAAARRRWRRRRSPRRRHPRRRRRCCSTTVSSARATTTVRAAPGSVDRATTTTATTAARLTATASASTAGLAPTATDVSSVCRCNLDLDPWPLIHPTSVVHWAILAAWLSLRLLLRITENCAVLWRTCLFLCLCVRSHISETTRPNFTKRLMRVTCGRGSVLLLRRCDTLCTSGFVDDLMFSQMGPMTRHVYS